MEKLEAMAEAAGFRLEVGKRGVMSIIDNTVVVDLIEYKSRSPRRIYKWLEVFDCESDTEN